MNRAAAFVALPVALALGAAACLTEGLRHSSSRPTSAPPAPLTPASPAAAGPVLAAARLPAASHQLGADVRLATALDAAFASPVVAPWQTCAEVDDHGVPVYARGAGSALIPASNLKLLTATAALDRLSAGATFTTEAAVAARADAKGVVAGPLYLIGGGDPLLSTDDYRGSQHQWTESAEPVTRLVALADGVKAAGITSVSGLIAVDSRYDGQRTVASWAPSYLADGEISPVGPLEVDGGTVVVGGRRVPAPDPAAAAADAFAALLTQRGIAVAGPVRHAPGPLAPISVATVTSPPLTTVIGEMLRESDNLAAEMLVKELGFRFGGAGTWAAGTAVVHDTLAAAGIPLEGVVQLDGSGLDRQDRVPCRTLAAIVATGTLEPEMPVAARCGTLVDRLVGQPAGGRVVGKTGSLAGVVALSGAVSATALAAQPCPPAGAAAAPVTFAVLLNGTPSIAAGESAADHLADLLAIYAGGA